MKIGYKIQDGFIEYYYENCTVLRYRALGNKRIKPERIYKYGQKRKFKLLPLPRSGALQAYEDRERTAGGFSRDVHLLVLQGREIHW